MSNTAARRSGNAPLRSASAPVRVAAAAAWDAKAALGHGEQLLLSMVLPCLALVVLSHTSVITVPTEDGASVIDTVTPGVLALAILSSAFAGQAISTGFDRRADVLAFLATTPLGRTGFITGRCLALLIQQVAQGFVIGTVALALGWSPPLGGALIALVGITAGSVALTSLALAMAGTLRAEAVLALANLMWILSSAAGVLLPLGHDTWWQRTGHLLPGTALADSLREAFVNSGIDWSATAVLAAWSVVGIGATVRWFKWRS